MIEHRLFPELIPDVRSTTGILPGQMIRQQIRSGAIHSEVPIEEQQIQPASLDLRLGPTAYELRASFLPGENSTVQKKLTDLATGQLDLTSGAVLTQGHIYLVPLLEHLHLPDNISGKANPKSTTGRLDIFTRVIVDYGAEFERVPESYIGPLYAEVVPRTFSIAVRTGMRLSQLRLIRGNPPSSDTALEELHRDEGLVYDEEDVIAEALIQKGLKIRLSLRAEAGAPAGYRARPHAPVIDLARIDHYDPVDFWEPLAAPADGRLILQQGAFYILGSKEKVRIPPSVAAEMVPYDPSVGEFRIHYAGFFDPGFGYGARDSKGTRAVLEVRAHEVPFLLEEGQIVCRLHYMPLLERPEQLYGAGIGSSYANQQVTLSKQFKRPSAQTAPGATSRRDVVVER